MNRRALQIITALMGILTIMLASMSLIFGVDNPIYSKVELPDLPELDSNLRFMGGMGIGLGAILLWITPNIEKQTLLFRAVWICAFLGGIGRIISMFTIGMPPLPITIFTIIEVICVPLFFIWQRNISISYSSRNQ